MMRYTRVYLETTGSPLLTVETTGSPLLTVGTHGSPLLTVGQTLSLPGRGEGPAHGCRRV